MTAQAQELGTQAVLEWNLNFSWDTREQEMRHDRASSLGTLLVEAASIGLTVSGSPSPRSQSGSALWGLICAYLNGSLSLNSEH